MHRILKQIVDGYSIQIAFLANDADSALVTKVRVSLYVPILALLLSNIEFSPTCNLYATDSCG